MRQLYSNIVKLLLLMMLVSGSLYSQYYTGDSDRGPRTGRGTFDPYVDPYADPYADPYVTNDGYHQWAGRNGFNPRQLPLNTYDYNAEWEMRRDNRYPTNEQLNEIYDKADSRDKKIFWWGLASTGLGIVSQVLVRGAQFNALDSEIQAESWERIERMSRIEEYFSSQGTVDCN